MKNDLNGIPTLDDGYVAFARCSLPHSGNRRFSLSVGEHYQCAGCGTSEHRSTILRLCREHH